MFLFFGFCFVLDSLNFTHFEHLCIRRIYVQICSKIPKTTSCICQATCDVEIVRSQAPLNVEHLAVPREKTCDAIKVIDSK